MVGTACFSLRFRGTGHCLTTVALSKSHYSSPHPYFIQIIGKPLVATPAVFQSRSQSQLHHQHVITNAEPFDSVSSALKGSLCHTRSCTKGGHELRCATIWHVLLPSHHPSLLDQTHHSIPYPTSPSVFTNTSGQQEVWFGHSLFASQQLHAGAYGLAIPHSKVNGLGRFSMAASLMDGSWNVAWDARPARWLHGRYSAWLLFGVCNCFSAVSGMSPKTPSHVNPDHEVTVANKGDNCDVAAPFEQNSASVGYRVTGMPTDGRCLFRAVAYGACVRTHETIPNENLQQELADNLRNKVVDELVSRRSESEWFIEEEFDSYVKKMREPYVWGGEPELLMASHVLKMPITVHLLDKSSGQLISVAEYGKEYGIENPIRVLYHGFGHYDSLQLDGEKIHP